MVFNLNPKKTFLYALLIVSFYTLSCTESAKNEQVAATMPEPSIDSIVKNGKDSMLCFRNESFIPAKPSDKDIDELKINFQSGVVRGEYNWLPKFKDQRKGKFEGILKDSVIHASYIFLQEGISDTSDIKITLKYDEAIVEGDRPELGLSKTIKKVDCEK